MAGLARRARANPIPPVPPPPTSAKWRNEPGRCDVGDRPRARGARRGWPRCPRGGPGARPRRRPRCDPPGPHRGRVGAGTPMTSPIPSLDELAADPSKATSLSAEAARSVMVRCAAVLAALGSTPPALVPQPVDDDRLLTTEDAAQRLGVSTDWLYRRAPRLPFTVRLERVLRFSARGARSLHPPAGGPLVAAIGTISSLTDFIPSATRQTWGSCSESGATGASYRSTSSRT